MGPLQNSHIRSAGTRAAFLDMDLLAFPLIVRNVRPGDRFTPFGMSGTQKVRKYLIDQKVPRSERWKFPVLLSGERIAWVVGKRIDDYFKVQVSTKNVLKVELSLA
jgi:tRNA(Ile)-lysidine synthase